MRKPKENYLLIFLLLLGLAGLSQAADTQKPAAAKPAWKVSGQLEEACHCDAACPCWFGSKPTHSTCGGGQALFINKGNYGNVSLNGLAIAQMTESPEGKSMMESMGHFQFDNVYIDANANPEQRKALEEIANHLLMALAPNRKIQYVPISRTMEGKEHHVKIGTVGAFSAHLIDAGLGGVPKIVNPPLADPIHSEYSQGRTSIVTYMDSGRNWNFANSNYMFNNFEVDSEQYAKYESDMEKKMGASKK